ncbi:matrix-remodeling-associated protein 7 [Lepus europaeus]|uniref:matrix-remodeling-associated protein 7 n=1 Tax=Lepus europaeus TaxID=9983 RepID=UPI002B488702|nr:matrix-remodeling-associated protein 7 [Lepus europaeus]
MAVGKAWASPAVSPCTSIPAELMPAEAQAGKGAARSSSQGVPGLRVIPFPSPRAKGARREQRLRPGAGRGSGLPRGPGGRALGGSGAMEAPAELLAALATALALLLAWLLVRRGGAAASPDPAPPAQPSAAPPEAPPGPCAPEPAAAPAGPEEPVEPVEPAAAPAQAEEQAAGARQEEEQDSESEKGLSPLSPEGPEEEDGDAFSFKYSPGKLRGNQYKKMMTKEELEEEQRLQKEQLAAIFRLMRDNSETFGEMSEGDVREQLRLYDM